ncbi:MAG: thioredoxin family protein [Planctomycetota bacterium]|jgi:hypothetical protein
MLMTAEILRREFDRGLPFREFVATVDTQEHQAPWLERYEQLALDAGQAALVGSFSRAMNLLCLTGPWCGDCALQGAAMARVADANAERIALRFIPRSEEHADLIVKNMINGGYRVPITWFMAEDFVPVSRFGDRTLSRYRSMARTALGEQSNVLAPPPADPVREVLREVLDEFERVQLLLRLSPRLRQEHGD